MSKDTFQLLRAEWEVRGDNGSDEIDELCELYEGNLPPEYDKYFPSSMPKHTINLVKLAWNDLSTSIGRVPDIISPPQNQSNAEAKRVSKIEKIAHSYLRDSAPNGKLFMRSLAWWLLTSRAVAICVPDHENKKPTFELRDPRFAKPSFEKTAANIPTKLKDIVFLYTMDRREAHARGLASASSTPLANGIKAGPTKGSGAQDEVEIIEYIDKDQWVLVGEEGYMNRVEHGLGVVPAYVFQTFSPNDRTGISLFTEQVSLMVAVSMFVSLKLAAADRMVNPIYWARGHQGSVKIGGSVLNKLSSAGEMGMLAPPTLPQVDRDIEMLQQFSRILNKNPEVRQGEVTAKGSYTSAKTLEQLSESVDSVVGEYWDIISVGLQELYRIAFIMDEKYWPRAEKSITGIMRGNLFSDTYVPKDDIAGRHYVMINHGFSVGGYQGFLQMLQAKDAKTVSRRRAVESMPGVTDAEEMLREIDLDDMLDAGKAMFAAQAASGEMDMILWSDMMIEMAEKGTPLHKVIKKYEEKIREQAQAAMAGPGGADAMVAAPPPDVEEAPAAPGPPGLPPAAMVG